MQEPFFLLTPKTGADPIISAEVDRNAWGRQIDSFIGPVAVENEQPHSMRIHQSPAFTDARKPSVIATFDGEPVGVRESNRIALTFHPELSGTTIFHEMLIEAALSVQRGPLHERDSEAPHDSYFVRCP